MSRRRRAALLTVAAVAAAGLGVALVSGYSASISDGYGRLRPVLVVSGSLSGGKKITEDRLRRQTELRQIPARFVPTGALSDPAAVVGLETAVPLASGSYLTAAVLRRPRGERPAKTRIGAGRVPVELAVSGVEALSGPGPRTTVDVLVTREGAVAGRGSTRLVAERVPLLAVTGQDSAGPGGEAAKVILAVTRSQAIELVDAEAFARKLTVIPGRPR